jgi:hypothetical protein
MCLILSAAGLGDDDAYAYALERATAIKTGHRLHELSG